jgi:hypothetical protein
MDADCIHGVTWYDCTKCFALVPLPEEIVGPLVCSFCFGTGIISGAVTVYARNHAGESIAWAKDPDRICPCTNPNQPKENHDEPHQPDRTATQPAAGLERDDHPSTQSLDRDGA